MLLSGTSALDPTQSGEFLIITPRGAVLKPKQPQALAVLETRLDKVVGDNSWYVLGTREKWNIVTDDDQSFHPGGDGKPLSFTTKHTGSYEITIQLDYWVSQRNGIIRIQITNTANNEVYTIAGPAATGITNYCHGTVRLARQANQQLVFDTSFILVKPAERIIDIMGYKYPKMVSYISVYFKG